MADYIDIYCERTAQGVLNEPLNALTNIAFFVAAVMAFRLMWRKTKDDGGGLDMCVLLMIIVLCAIGAGSFLFHTLATGWAQLADTTPILLFQIMFLSVYARRVIGFRGPMTIFLVGLFFAFAMAFGLMPQDWMNGSMGYAPALLFLSGLGVYHAATDKTDRFGLLLASTVFLVSLMFRTSDQAVCWILPTGVHFFWHILNAVVLYLCLRVLIVNRTQPVATTDPL